MSNNEEYMRSDAHHRLHEHAVTPEQIGDMTDIGMDLARIANNAYRDGDMSLHDAFVKRAGILIGRDTKGANEIERRNVERQYRELLTDTVRVFDTKGLYTHHEQYGGEVYSIANVVLPLVGVRESECYLDMKFTKIEAAGELVEIQFERNELPIESSAHHHAVTLNANGLFMFTLHGGQPVMSPADHYDSNSLFVHMKSDDELIKVMYGQLEALKR